MTTERKDGPTPNGGDYAVATYVNRETMEEVDQQTATGIVIAEYATSPQGDRWIGETVAEYVFEP